MQFFLQLDARYGIANCIMVKYITNENGTLMFICKKCDKDKYSAYKTSFIVFHSPNYMNSMLSIHPIYIQLLSLVDIGQCFYDNMNTNPLFKLYFTIFEQTNKTNSMCILSSKIVNNIFQNHNTHEGLHLCTQMNTFKVCHCYLICKEYHQHLQKK